MTSTILQLVDVHKQYNQVVALENINLEIYKGEFITVLGPSGSGKSTLLKIIGGFEEPSKGDIFIDGKRFNGIPPYKRPTSMVFQDLALFPHLDVFNNIAYGLKVRKTPEDIVKNRVKEVAELLHIENLLDRKVTQLSGGQQQRVALARSLVIEPEILLLDEPLGPLDLKLRREMQLELRKIQQRLKATWIYVTHDHEEAMVMSDRVVIIHAGKIQDIGKIREIYEKPKTRFTAEFLGETNLTECIVESDDGTYITAFSDDIVFQLPSQSRTEVGKKINIVIRPEKIRITRQLPERKPNTATGIVSEVICRGPYTDVKVTINGSKTMVVRTLDEFFSVGERVYLMWRSEDIALVND